MEGDKDKLLNELGGAPEDGEPLFSAFRARPAPAPAPQPAAAPPPAAPAQPPQQAHQAPQPVPLTAPVQADRPAPQFHAARLTPVERKPDDAPHAAAPQSPQDRDLLDYLKHKVDEIEVKLREAQEKGLAFAYEVKGREEARKESRREMDEFLAEVKKQQSVSESERARGLELEKARTRIEALEQKIMELSGRKPEAQPAARAEAASEELEKLRALLQGQLKSGFEELGRNLTEAISKENSARLAAGFEDLGRSLAEKISKENSAQLVSGFEELGWGLTEKISEENAARLAAGLEEMGGALGRKIFREAIEPITARLNAESEAREKDKYDLRLLANNIADRASTLEGFLSGRLAEVDGLLEGLSARLREAGDGREEMRSLAASSFERVSKLEDAVKTRLGAVTPALEEFHREMKEVCASAEASRKEATGVVQELRQALQAAGSRAADSAAAGVGAGSGQYDLGFINACFDNLEKAFAAASETLARTGAAAKETAELPPSEALPAARRQAAILDSAARDLAKTLAVFRGVREEALAPIKKMLGG